MLLTMHAVEIEKTMVDINLMQTIIAHVSYSSNARLGFRQKAKGVVIFCSTEGKLNFR